MTFELGPNQRKWVEALKSGKYEQIQGELRILNYGGVINGYCCLGVACDLYDPNLWDDRHHDGNTGEPSDNVADWLGLHTTNGFVDLSDHKEEFEKILVDNCYSDSFDTVTELTTINDDYYVSFKGIAELVEAFPQEFFKESK